MVTFFIFILGIAMGFLLAIVIGAYHHRQELKEAAENPDPKVISEIAAYVVENIKLKELQK